MGRTIVVMTVGLLLSTNALAQEAVPTIPAGSPAVIFPVQAVRSMASGAWPGGAPTDRETLERMDAELKFAFEETPRSETFVLPHEVVRRMARNPLLNVDPYRVAYHGLLREPKSTDQIYEPLHTQLRQVAALFDARIVVLPMVMWFERDDLPKNATPEQLEEWGEANEGRAVVLTAIIDVRRSQVLWHGEIRGALEKPSSPALISTLAFSAARQLVP